MSLNGGEDVLTGLSQRTTLEGLSEHFKMYWTRAVAEQAELKPERMRILTMKKLAETQWI